MSLVMSIIAFVIVFLTACATTNNPSVSAARTPAASDPASRLKVPRGFKITTFALLPGARSIARTPDGKVIFVGTGGLSGGFDVVYRVKDFNGDGKIDPDEF